MSSRLKKFIQHISPSNTSCQCPRRQSSGSAASLHFDVVNERQRPRGTARCFYWGGPAGGSSHGRGPCSDSGPLSLPSDSQRPSLRAGWEVRVSPLWDAVQMMGTWTLRSAAGLHFREVFLRDVSPSLPPSSVAWILYLTELWRPVRHLLVSLHNIWPH